MKLNKLDIAYGVLIFLSLIALIYLLIIRQPKIENVEVDVPVELGFGNYNLIYGGVAALSTFGLFSYFVRNNFIQNRFSKLIAIPAENAGSENYQTLIKKDANVINSDNLKWAFIVKLQNNFNYLKDKIYSTILYGYDKILFAYANNEVGNLILYGLTAVIVTLVLAYLVYRLLFFVLDKTRTNISELTNKVKKCLLYVKLAFLISIILLKFKYIDLKYKYFNSESEVLEKSIQVSSEITNSNEKDQHMFMQPDINKANYFKKYTEGEINYIINTCLIPNSNMSAPSFKNYNFSITQDLYIKLNTIYKALFKFTNEIKSILKTESDNNFNSEILLKIKNMSNDQKKEKVNFILKQDLLSTRKCIITDEQLNQIYDANLLNYIYTEYIDIFLENYFIKIKKYEALDKLYRKVPFLFEDNLPFTIPVPQFLNNLNQNRNFLENDYKKNLYSLSLNTKLTEDEFYKNEFYEKIKVILQNTNNVFLDIINQITDLEFRLKSNLTPSGLNRLKGAKLFNYLLNSDEGRKELNIILISNNLNCNIRYTFNAKDTSFTQSYNVLEKGNIAIENSDTGLNFRQLILIEEYLNNTINKAYETGFIKSVPLDELKQKRVLLNQIKEKYKNVDFTNSEIKNILDFLLINIQKKIAILSDLDSLQFVIEVLLQSNCDMFDIAPADSEKILQIISLSKQ